MYSRLCAEREAGRQQRRVCCPLTLHVGGGILDTRVPQNKNRASFMIGWVSGPRREDLIIRPRKEGPKQLF